MALVASWPTFLEDSLRQAKDAEGLLHAGAERTSSSSVRTRPCVSSTRRQVWVAPSRPGNGALMRLDRGALATAWLLCAFWSKLPRRRIARPESFLTDWLADFFASRFLPDSQGRGEAAPLPA